MQNPILIIGGPTASGKSAFAVNIAKEIDAVIINADSMQLYQEIPVVTAQPNETEQQGIPHKLYGALPASVNCSVAMWLELVLPEIEQAHQQGKLPIVIGGTGMYIRSLMEGISSIPEISPEVREPARALLKEIGNEAFHQKLAEVDAVMAGRLPIGDSQRMLRAYEVIKQTGRSLAEWQQDEPRRFYPKERFVSFVVKPPREKLYDNCNKRFLKMLEQGVLEEVKALDALGLNESLPAMKALGVPELRKLLHGEYSEEEAIDKAQQATRRYAKRQVTWFSNQMTEAHVITDPKNCPEAVQIIKDGCSK